MAVKVHHLMQLKVKQVLMDIIIETPKGSRQKYTYDKEYKLFRLKKVLAPGLVFPFDFGFICFIPYRSCY
jgi:inorganic pyrophosphatase